MQFHETIMGKKFFESTLPDLVKAFQTIARKMPEPQGAPNAAIQERNDQYKQQLCEEIAKLEITPTSGVEFDGSKEYVVKGADMYFLKCLAMSALDPNPDPKPMGVGMDQPVPQGDGANGRT